MLYCYAVPVAIGVCLFMALPQAVAVDHAPKFSTVFASGDGGFPVIRIPSILVTKRGTLLAFAEGRANGASDQADNKIVLKRSSDGGNTWGEIQVVADGGTACLNNPCAVVEQKSGRVFVVFQSYPAGATEANGKLHPGVEGPSIVRNLIIHSDDDGATWSKPLDITKATKRPEVVTTVASGPGIGIQLRRGRHAGRLIIPFNEGPWDRWNIYVIYSDDRGKTWRMGSDAPGALVPNGHGGEISQVNEAQVVELADGSVRFNVRRWGGKPLRKTCVSHDGGETWSRVEDVPDLECPCCMASVYRYSFPTQGQKSRILFSGPQSGAHSTKRENGTICMSSDEGATWPVKRVLWPGDFAYSCLTALPDGTAGCLFETDNYNRIVFARFTLNWLIGS